MARRGRPVTEPLPRSTPEPEPSTPAPAQGPAAEALTPEQRAIVEADDGPVVVIAGAGTGKTRGHRGARALAAGRRRGASSPGARAAEPTPRHGNPFEGPLVPEQLLVLTYNVKAARELQERLDAVVGAGDPRAHGREQLPQLLPARPHRIQRGRRPARAPGRARRRRPDAPPAGPAAKPRPAVPHGLRVPGLRPVHQPRQGRAGGPRRLRHASSRRSAGSTRPATAASTRRTCASRPRATSRRCARSAAPTPASAPTSAPRTPASCASTTPRAFVKATDREARRTIAGDGHARGRNHFADEDHARIDTLADDYERDGAALEILRLTEIGRRLPRLRGRAGRPRRPRLRRADRRS